MGFLDRFSAGFEIVKGSMTLGWTLYPFLISLLFFTFFIGTFVVLVISIIYLMRYAVIFFVLMLLAILLVRPLYHLVISKWALKKSGLEPKKITLGRLFWYSMVTYSGSYFVKSVGISEGTLSQEILKTGWFYFRYFLPMSFLITDTPSKAVEEALKASSKVYQEIAISAFSLKVILASLIVFSLGIIIASYYIYPSIIIFLIVLSVTFIISFLFYYSLNLVVSSRLFAYSNNSDTSVLKDIKLALNKLGVV